MTLCSFMDFMSKFWLWFVLLIPYTFLCMWVGGRLVISELEDQMSSYEPVCKISTIDKGANL